LTAEISCIYSKKERVRKIHIVVFSSSFDVCEKINKKLGEIGNLKSDGRPILGLDAKELAKIVLSASPDCMVVPAHIWTPWFSLFGSKSGFNSIEECFEDYSKYIYACETGRLYPDNARCLFAGLWGVLLPDGLAYQRGSCYPGTCAYDKNL